MVVLEGQWMHLGHSFARACEVLAVKHGLYFLKVITNYFEYYTAFSNHYLFLLALGALAEE